MAGMTVSCAKVKYFISIKDESVALKLKMCQMTRQKREIIILFFCYSDDDGSKVTSAYICQ